MSVICHIKWERWVHVLFTSLANPALVLAKVVINAQHTLLCFMADGAHAIKSRSFLLPRKNRRKLI